ncbi:fldA [Wigglesworthia glossinidia endosymbiont of Glossina brevipalpis]|uniref:Flavodoxin n=1 Tax=Wigglesworthia glossinidia brevipalpis TaxID=36870 RepID=Q8D2C8_WIGBR|nr:fldA [Wigglesworthia glossinidia endosymbiont of Glossina brevipalpis]
MKSIGMFFGSDTGNTERIAKKIQKKIGINNIDIFDISNSSKEEMEKYKKLIFGIPTWYYGELQCDWDDFLIYLKEINFENKLVAIFGCGDQEDYSEYFCDAMGIVKEIISYKGAKVIGKYSTLGYKFEKSKALLNKDYFIGLAIDEDRQPELTEKRICNWVKTIKKEMEI